MARSAKRPRSAKSRTLPPDPVSLKAMFASLHRDFIGRAEHLKRTPSDYNARRGFQTLFEQRAACWAKLFELAPAVALRIAAHHDLEIPAVGSNAEVR